MHRSDEELSFLSQKEVNEQFRQEVCQKNEYIQFVRNGVGRAAWHGRKSASQECEPLRSNSVR